MNAETHEAPNVNRDLKDRQEERKHLENLFAERINFYLVFAAGVLAFLVDKDHPTPIVKWALWAVSFVSVLTCLALIRTFVLVRIVLHDLPPNAIYKQLCERLKWWKWIIPNANNFLLVLPVALTMFFVYSCAVFRDNPAKTKDGDLRTSAVGTDVTPVIRANRVEIVDSAGVARMRLGAPLPDATPGKPQKGRSAAGGIQLNDAKGNEVGGLVMQDETRLVVRGKNGKVIWAAP